MKTKFALLDENNRIIETSEGIDRLVDLRNNLNDRRNGKTTRAIFQALSSPNPVAFVSPTNIMSKLMYNNVITMLDYLGFEYEKNLSSLTIKPLYSGIIRFIPNDPSLIKGATTSNTRVIYDL